ncbi:MAG: pseudouridine synthase [Christensenellales bacterium]
MRLQKYMALAGIASRRKCETLINEGRVTINGETAMLGAVVKDGDQITLDGTLLHAEQPKLYYLFYKPCGVVTTLKDPQGRKTVLDFFTGHPRLFPVGRLDLNTEGLLLMTNDGELSNRILHPSYKIQKTYYAEIEGELTAPQLEALKAGVTVENGEFCTADDVILLQKKAQKGNQSVRLILHEGKNRQVRRMLQAVGCRVKFLRREKLGNLTLKGLIPGMYRPLTQAEIDQLKKSCKI